MRVGFSGVDVIATAGSLARANIQEEICKDRQGNYLQYLQKVFNRIQDFSLNLNVG